MPFLPICWQKRELFAGITRRLNGVVWMQSAQSRNENIPRHIAFIMDGNGRWAAKRGLPRTAGHRQGAKTLEKICDHCERLGVQYVTTYAFSTENWKRPQDEIDAIMDLLRNYLKEAQKQLRKNVKLKFIGDFSVFDKDMVALIEKAHQDSLKNTGMTVCIALNYGGRAEITNVAKQLAADVLSGKVQTEEIDENLFGRYLGTDGLPDPDLLIRPSGEKRLSNFLLWQAAYTEFVFMDVLWPDFSEKDLDRAIQEYQKRDRRFGGI